MKILIHIAQGLLIMFGDYEYCPDIVGKYYHVSTNIEICTGLTRDLTRDTIVHEIGHKYWFEDMTRAEKRGYKKIYDENLGDINNYYRKYSMTNIEEDFADIFMYVILGKSLERNEGFYDKVEYIENNLQILENSI